MHSLTIFVDADALPEYTEGHNYIGLTVAPVLDRPEQATSLAELWRDSRALARPWRWELAGFLVVDIPPVPQPVPGDAPSLAQVTIRRIEPPGHRRDEVVAWLDERAERYLARVHSLELLTLLSLRWPQSERSLPALRTAVQSLARVTRKETLPQRYGQRLDRLGEGPKFKIRDAVGIVRDIIADLQASDRIKDRQEIVQALVRLRAAQDASVFAEKARTAAQMLAETPLDGETPERMRACAYYRFAATETAAERETPDTALGFLGNLTTVMAPVPQVGQLSHVVYFERGPAPGTSFSLVPLVKFKVGDQEFEISEERVRAALEGAEVSGGLLELSVPMEVPGSSVAITLRATVLASSAGSDNELHEGLWAKKVTLGQGVRSRHARADITAGLDLLAPLLAGLDDFAVIPSPDSTFRLAARTLRDHVLPEDALAGDKPRRRSALRRALEALFAEDARVLALSEQWRETRKTYLDREVFADTLRSRSSSVAAAYAPWDAPRDGGARGQERTIAARAEDDSGEVSLHVRHVYESGWRLDRATVRVSATLAEGATAALERWEASVLAWRAYDEQQRSPRAVGRTLEFDVTEIARHGLRAGRYRVVSKTAEGSKALSQFILPPDGEGLAPVRALLAAASDPKEHVELVHALLPAVDAPGWREALARFLSREAVGEDNLHPKILKVLRGEDKSFAAQVELYWRELSEPLQDEPAPPRAPRIDAALTEAMKEHGERYWQAVEQRRTQAAAGTLPLEIGLALPCEDPEDDGDDPLANLAGAGALLRIKGDGDERLSDEHELGRWRCLSAAQLDIGAGQELVGVVGLPIGYVDGVATVHVAYEGLPVAAHPLTTDPDGHALFAAGETGAPALELASYEVVERDDPPSWARVPRLVYGRVYEALGFFIHQTGALPQEIADPQSPWSLRDPLRPGRTPRDATYKRTAPIGAPRLRAGAVDAGKGSGKRRADLGATIPEGVHPLARDLPRAAVLGGGSARRFFRGGRRGELDLDDGFWALTVEGIEARKFAPGGVVALRIEARSTSPGAVEPLLALVIEREGKVLRIALETPNGWRETIHESELMEPLLTAPLSVYLRCAPLGDQNKCLARIELWAADDDANRAKHEKVSELLGRMCEREVFLAVSATGAAAEDTTASVAFGVPRVETGSGLMTDATADDAPIVLLAKGKAFRPDAVRTSFVLDVRAPAVDLECWERHRGSTGSDAWMVRAGWQIGLERNEEARTGRAEPPIDLGLDDPSVTHLMVAVVPLFARHESAAAVRLLTYTAHTHVPTSGASTLDDDDIRALLSPAIRKSDEVRIVGGDAAMVPQLSGGEIWEVLVWPLVPRSERGSLAAEAANLLVEAGHGGNAFLAGPASRVVLECATDELPSFEELRAALTPSLVGRAIQVTCEPRAVASSLPAHPGWCWRAHTFSYLHDATLARQMWRWSGRPIGSYPFGAVEKFCARPSIANLRQNYHEYMREELERIKPCLEWEVRGFGDRDQADYLTTSHVLRPFAVTDLRREELAGDSRAQHWRFRLAARSRYAGLLRDGGRTVDAPAAPAGASIVQDRWSRRFVPAAPPADLKPPSVRVVLPLTETAGASEHKAPPPLLVVLDDPWYDIGGLGEDFVADVESVEHGKSPEKQGEKLFQIGPDPIREGLGTKLEKVSARIKGPIGYTYDGGATAQRFAHSSFLVEVGAKKEDKDTKIPDWSFVKLTFQRRIDGSSTTDKVERTSPRTQAMWCQFAADFSRFATSDGDITSRELVVVKHDGGVRLRRRADGSEVALRPHSPPVGESELQTVLWAVITERVVDVARRESERYLATFSLADHKKIHGSGTSGAGKLVLRVLEVEMRKPPEGGEQADKPVEPSLTMLWPSPVRTWDATRAADAVARIVKVSAPIEGVDS